MPDKLTMTNINGNSTIQDGVGVQKIDDVEPMIPTSKISTNDTNPEAPDLPPRRIKAPPICRGPSLRKMNMSADKLSEWCFEPGDVLHGSTKMAGGNGDGDGEDMTPAQWAEFKNSILQCTESRNGRDHQRFANNAQTGHLLRLTTGSVPIMRDGRILLVSSSRKEEWILPKGGWESDEKIEVR